MCCGWWARLENRTLRAIRGQGYGDFVAHTKVRWTLQIMRRILRRIIKDSLNGSCERGLAMSSGQNGDGNCVKADGINPATHHAEAKYQGAQVPKPRAEWIAKRKAEAAQAGDANFSQMHYARKGVVTEEMAFIAHKE